MIRAFFAAIMVLAPLATVQSQERNCSEYAAPPDAKKFVYCEAFLVGHTQKPGQKGDAGQKRDVPQTLNEGFMVSLESKFFAGLKRVKKHGTFRFEKDRREVLDYPASFTVYVEKSDIAPSASSGQSPKTETPSHVIVRWFGPSHQLIGEAAADLERTREAWPELRAPRIWYRGNISNSAVVPLTSEMEIRVIGDNGEVIGTVTRVL